MTPTELEHEADKDSCAAITPLLVTKWEKLAAYYRGIEVGKQKALDFTDEKWRHRIWSYTYFPQHHTEELARGMDAVLSVSKDVETAGESLAEATWMSELASRMAGFLRMRYQGLIDIGVGNKAGKAKADPEIKRENGKPKSGPPTHIKPR